MNRYYRNVKGKTLISAEGRLFRKAVEQALVGRVERQAGRLAVVIACHAPDRRRRDLDNLTKGLLDALTHAGAWDDDSQIDDLRLVRGEMVKQGLVRVEIKGI